MTDRVDVVVVGGGLAGLTAAAKLARAGRSVTLFDSRKKPGGRARSNEVDGFVLNEGPHALYRTGRAAEVLGSLGIQPDGAAPPIERSSVVARSEVHDLPTNPLELIRSRVLTGRAKAAAASIFPALQFGRDRRATDLTLAEWLDRRKAPPDLRAMIETYVRLATYSNAPEFVSAPAALAQVALAVRGVWYLHGGWQQLVDALVDRATAAGVEFRRRTVVSGLARDGASWVATSDDDPVAATDVVIAASGPQTATRLAGQDPGWVDGAGPPSRVTALDVGFAGEPERPILLSMDEPIYASTHAPTARLAPDGCSLVSAMRYLRFDERPEKEAARAELEQHVEAMGVPDWTNDRFLHTMTASHGIPMARIPRPTGLELGGDGIWACGDWTAGSNGAGAFLSDAAVGSAADVAAAILRRV